MWINAYPVPVPDGKHWIRYQNRKKGSATLVQGDYWRVCGDRVRAEQEEGEALRRQGHTGQAAGRTECRAHRTRPANHSRSGSGIKPCT